MNTVYSNILYISSYISCISLLHYTFHLQKIIFQYKQNINIFLRKYIKNINHISPKTTKKRNPNPKKSEFQTPMYKIKTLPTHFTFSLSPFVPKPS